MLNAPLEVKGNAWWVMKELPSDIWHPLLLFSFNQEKETEGGEEDRARRKVGFMCQQAKWHGGIYSMPHANIFK